MKNVTIKKIKGVLHYVCPKCKCRMQSTNKYFIPTNLKCDCEIEYDDLPENIKSVIDSYNEDKDSYAECSRIQGELEILGWTCDYGLDGEIFDLKPK